ncbi:uncharacterized protein LOC126578415 [Anopheles aquasalis]|uniref:uncharacterized protein LOC126578415 n=1 Tax=Anopheles aquasalis TaxID=42839 RepID=UPI00215AA447|nr:uncharacterized protein LOC126578415 [Anopheles aquasalis]
MDFYYRKVMIVAALVLVSSAFVKTTEAAPTPTREYNPLAVLPLLKLENSLPQTLPKTSTTEAEPLSRSKREIIFRPLFVYRHQQIKHNLANAKYQMIPNKIDYDYYQGQYF